MIFDEFLKSVIQVLGVSWWIVIPLILFFVFWEIWLFYIRRRYVNNLDWRLLEIRVPRGIEKTPKAMEQVFAAMYGAYSYGFNLKQKYWEGAVESWFSFELVGYAGGIYFYIRTPQGNRNLVESAIYSQYPDAEIREVEDYLGLIGSTVPNKAYDIWGTDLILAREDCYPIRTYSAFEEKTDEARLDPVAIITEVMSKLKEGERILIQTLIRPAGSDWVKKGEELRDKLIDRKKAQPKGIFSGAGEFGGNLLRGAFEPPVWTGAQEEKKDQFSKLLAISPGEKDIVEGIEKKISKLGFDTIVRFIFIDDREKFSQLFITAVMGAFHQFNTQNLNAFKPNKPTLTVVRKGLFKKRRVHLRKRRLYDNYILRHVKPKTSILNIEELATIFHFPSIAVEAPLLRHVPAKKGEPPPGLPVE